jgi:putative glutamine amidotransferase
MPPRIAIPVPTSSDHEYNRQSWPQYAAAVAQSGGTPVEIPLTDPPATTAKLIATCQAILLPGSPADVNPQKYGQLPQPETNPPDPARENVDELLLQDAHNLHKPIFTICFGTQMLNVWRGGTLVQHLMPMPINHAAGPAVAIAHTAVLAPNSLLATLAAETDKAVILSEGASALQSKDPPPGSYQQSGSPYPATEAILPNTQPATDNLQLPRIPINSSHHQAIAIPGDGLRVTARSPHDAVIEAVEPTPEAVILSAAKNPRISLSPPPTSNLEPAFLIAVQWHPERTFATDPISRALFHRFIAAASTWQPLAPTLPAAVRAEKDC